MDLFLFLIVIGSRSNVFILIWNSVANLGSQNANKRNLNETNPQKYASMMRFERISNYS